MADRNQEFLEEQGRLKAKNREKNNKNKGFIKGVGKAEPEKSPEEQVTNSGLSKSIFYSTLLKQGVLLNEHEKAIITTVFGLRNSDADKLDYQKLDSAFEGVQQ